MEVFCSKSSIWVAWNKENLIRGRSFWIIIKISLKCYWGWSKLLKLRKLTRQFITSSVGDGKKKKKLLWLDLWHPNDILCTGYGYRVACDAARNLKTKVSTH